MGSGIAQTMAQASHIAHHGPEARAHVSVFGLPAYPANRLALRQENLCFTEVTDDLLD